MSYEYSYAQICAQMNASLDLRAVMEYVGWWPDKLVRNGDVWLGLCPIHKEEVFRTLVLNPRNNTYECKHVNCAGNSPADLLDLVVKTSGKTLPEVLMDMIGHFGAEHFRLTEKQLEFIGDLVRQVEDWRSGRTQERPVTEYPEVAD